MIIIMTTGRTRTINVLEATTKEEEFEEREGILMMKKVPGSSYNGREENHSILKFGHVLLYISIVSTCMFIVVSKECFRVFVSFPSVCSFKNLFYFCVATQETNDYNPYYCRLI